VREGGACVGVFGGGWRVTAARNRVYVYLQACEWRFEMERDWFHALHLTRSVSKLLHRLREWTGWLAIPVLDLRYNSPRPNHQPQATIHTSTSRIPIYSARFHQRCLNRTISCIQASQSQSGCQISRLFPLIRASFPIITANLALECAMIEQTIELQA
jgi:hypothetical protein